MMVRLIAARSGVVTPTVRVAEASAETGGRVSADETRRAALARRARGFLRHVGRRISPL